MLECSDPNSDRVPFVTLLLFMIGCQALCVTRSRRSAKPMPARYAKANGYIYFDLIGRVLGTRYAMFITQRARYPNQVEKAIFSPEVFWYPIIFVFI